MVGASTTLSVSIIVVIAGAGVLVTMSIVVTAVWGDPFVDVAAAGPPSTGTTE